MDKLKSFEKIRGIIEEKIGPELTMEIMDPGWEASLQYVEAPERFCSMTKKLLGAIPQWSYISGKRFGAMANAPGARWLICDKAIESRSLYRPCEVYRSYDHYEEYSKQRELITFSRVLRDCTKII